MVIPSCFSTKESGFVFRVLSEKMTFGITSGVF